MKEKVQEVFVSNSMLTKTCSEAIVLKVIISILDFMFVYETNYFNV